MSPVFSDSHSHLADPAFDPDREAVIQAAREAGARAIVCIGESPDMADRARSVAQGHAGFIWYTAGRHPHEASLFHGADDQSRIHQHLVDGAVAVGECGLDYHYDNSPRDVQRRVFAAQLSLASSLQRPVVVHTRDAAEDTAAAIHDAESAGVTGVLHCFTGPPFLMETALAAGWYVSFSGVVTFRKWTDDDLVRAVPAERLLVESDAPWLAPVPFRGERNQPAHVALTVNRVAQVRGVPPEALGEQLVANTARLFRLATPGPEA